MGPVQAFQNAYRNGYENGFRTGYRARLAAGGMVTELGIVADTTVAATFTSGLTMATMAKSAIEHGYQQLTDRKASLRELANPGRTGWHSCGLACAEAKLHG
jgi:hypothetical protein